MSKSTDEKTEQMRAMVAQLNEAADAYYNGRGELMTDFEWDALFDKLKALEDETGVVLDESPTHRVSADDVAGQKEPHEYPALSLAKTKRWPTSQNGPKAVRYGFRGSLTALPSLSPTRMAALRKWSRVVTGIPARTSPTLRPESAASRAPCRAGGIWWCVARR